MNSSITIFGGTGDLTYRKLMPALYNLFARGLLNGDDLICAIGRKDYNQEDYHKLITKWIEEFARLEVKEEVLQAFLTHVHYLKMDLSKKKEYSILQTFYQDRHYDNTIVYYAVAPSFFEVITDGLSQVTNLSKPKIVLEKPFGESLEQAFYLNEKLEAQFGKDAIYRIDHYLGKEMIRNILTIRQTNYLIANMWSKEHIQCVHISAAERVGVGSRGSYYEQAGALKDMVQNHLLQILTIVALDDPDAELAQQQKEVLEHLRVIDASNVKDSVVLGQYEGYCLEEEVDPTSNVETYAALKVHIDHKRWKGVPFYIRTGKRCSHPGIEVVVTFKRMKKEVAPNVLIIKIQPTEGVDLQLNVRHPQEELGLKQVWMEYCQNCEDIFRLNTPEAYERMLWACLNNDASWFSKWDQIALSWKYIDGIKEAYKQKQLPVKSYPVDSSGPSTSELTNDQEDHQWRIA